MKLFSIRFILFLGVIGLLTPVYAQQVSYANARFVAESFLKEKGTALGGKYGTGVKVNYSLVHAIDHSPHLSSIGTTMGSDGYGSAFWKWGDQTYYQDINVQFDKRLSKDFHLHLMYMNQLFNKAIVQHEGGMVRSNIFVVEGKYNFSRKTALRSELQYLSTKDDDGDWLYALAELSLAPHWMFTLSDMYNSGKTDLHYYQGYVTCSLGAHRLQLGYGRTRAGYNCAGGVCRFIPCQKGFNSFL